MNITEAANIALGHLGTARLYDIEENTVAAEQVRRFLVMARRETLRQFPWNFARARASLARSAVAPEFGWAAAYPLPADYLQLLEVNGQPAGAGDAEYEVEGASILTDETRCEIRYIRDVEAVSRWCPNFLALYAYELAKLLAPSFTTDTGVIAQLEQLAGPARERAREANSLETRARVLREDPGASDYQRARMGCHFLA
jgi:hypothetical protein